MEGIEGKGHTTNKMFMKKRNPNGLAGFLQLEY